MDDNGKKPERWRQIERAGDTDKEEKRRKREKMEREKGRRGDGRRKVKGSKYRMGEKIDVWLERWMQK